MNNLLLLDENTENGRVDDNQKGEWLMGHLFYGDKLELYIERMQKIIMVGVKNQQGEQETPEELIARCTQLVVLDTEKKELTERNMRVPAMNAEQGRLSDGGLFPETEYCMNIPFKGDAKLFECRTEPWIQNPITGETANNVLRITHISKKCSKVQSERILAEKLAEVQKNIIIINESLCKLKESTMREIKK